MVVTPERVYFLQAETSKEYERWVEVLKKAITYWKKQSTKKTTNLRNIPQVLPIINVNNFQGKRIQRGILK